MPEDAFIGFNFFSTGNGLSIVNDAAQRNAAERLANDIAFGNAFQHLDTALGAVQSAARHKAQRNDPDWEDNVPPDLTDGFDFLL